MNYYNEIKQELINNEITKRVKDYSKNRSDLATYYEVGKLLTEASKHYGGGIIQEYSKKLKNELNKKYSVRLLYRMLKYYNFVSDEKMPTVSAKLSISYYDELLSLNDVNIIKYYLIICEQQNLSVRQLRNKIKSNEYERLDEETKNKLITNDKIKVTDLVKNPIIIKNNYIDNDISEKVLQKLILEDLPSFLEELGNGFTFIKNEYKIKIGDRYNYIDLLLFNIEYNCYVVIELKVTELKKEYIGQIEVYMNYIDDNIKSIEENDTVGIIICKEANDYIIKYCSDNRIISREYIIKTI